jgi:hypothetical protein
MGHHSALYVRIPEGVPREHVFQRVRELLAETAGRHEVRLYRVAPWVEVLCPHSEALWHTVTWLSQQGQCETVALEVETGADTLYYRRMVGGRLARELKYSLLYTREGPTKQGSVSASGQPEPWEAEVFTGADTAGPAPVWTRDAQEGERYWHGLAPVDTARGFGLITRALGLPAGDGLGPGDGIEQSVVLPGIRPGVEERGQRPPGGLSVWSGVGVAAVLAAFVWMAVGGVTPLHGGTWAALPLAWVGYIVLLRRRSGVVAFGGGFIAMCLTLIAAMPFSGLLH